MIIKLILVFSCDSFSFLWSSKHSVFEGEYLFSYQSPQTIFASLYVLIINLCQLIIDIPNYMICKCQLTKWKSHWASSFLTVVAFWKEYNIPSTSFPCWFLAPIFIFSFPAVYFRIFVHFQSTSFDASAIAWWVFRCWNPTQTLSTGLDRERRAIAQPRLQHI